MSDRIQWIAIFASVVVLVLLPLGLSPFNLVLLTEILLMALFALSFNLLFGYTGLLSFGHAAYFATGAYVCAYLIVKVSVEYVTGVLGLRGSETREAELSRRESLFSHVCKLQNSLALLF